MLLAYLSLFQIFGALYQNIACFLVPLFHRMMYISLGIMTDFLIHCSKNCTRCSVHDIWVSTSSVHYFQYIKFGNSIVSGCSNARFIMAQLCWLSLVQNTLLSVYQTSWVSHGCNTLHTFHTRVVRFSYFCFSNLHVYIFTKASLHLGA